jgi:hypothetical protein
MKSTPNGNLINNSDAASACPDDTASDQSATPRSSLELGLQKLQIPQPQQVNSARDEFRQPRLRPVVLKQKKNLI